ncbi:MAG TPA: triose-phosphate isomerase [Candidatus Megaira endosymbiont of Nemacystus decipiens]|nr:triose-phosphate isomerase [Candidatus Megaera endosymbiont of Nemacystus decipiens]
MKQLIILNWKMNLLLNEAIKLNHEISNIKHSYELIIAPPTPYIGYLSQTKNIKYCAQNVSIYDGLDAKTGEYSAEILKSCGIDYTIIGHSERRTFMMETNHMIKRKIQTCMQEKIIPILCVGETIEARKSNSYREYIEEQLKVIPENIENIVIAYEPIWAIGSGITPTLDEISEIISYISSNEHLTKLANKPKLIYGGSVNSANIKDICNLEEMSGVLIGSAALKIEELKSILK